MAEIYSAGVTPVWWVPTISDTTAPAAATELNVGTNLTTFTIDLPDVPQTGNTADTSDLADAFNTRKAASHGGDNITITGKRDDTTDTFYDTLPRGTSGYLVVGYDGIAGGVAGTWAAADRAWVYTVEVLSRTIPSPGRDGVQQVVVELAITAPPDEDVAVAA